MSHILDFFFVGPDNLVKCLADLSTFISVCRDIGVPLKKEKTVWPTTNIVIYGIEVDSVAMVSYSETKVFKIRTLPHGFSKRKNVKLRKLQSLLDLLNFATGCVVPSRAFLSILYYLTINVHCPVFLAHLSL